MIYLIACVTYNNDVHKYQIDFEKKGEEHDEIRRCFGRNISLHTSVCYFVKHNFLEFKGHLYIYFIGCLRPIQLV